MIDEAFDELAHAALDGTATPEQRATLDARVASDPEARERWLDFETAHTTLARVRNVEPPLDLKPAIMRAIHAERRSSAPGHFEGARERIGRAIGLRLASAFAIGAVAGILIWPLISANRSSFRNLPTSGTMMPEPGTATIDRLSLAAGTSTLTIELVAMPRGVAARMETNAGGNAEIVIEHDATLTAESVREIEARPLRVALATGAIGLEFAGEMRCSVLLKGARAAKRPMRVTLRAGGMASTGELNRRTR